VRKAAVELYGLPLDRFTRERDALARRLRGEGEREEAAEVAALRKPVLAAWVVNQLARRRKAEMRELLQAAKAVKAGRKDADERYRAAVETLGRSARTLLEDDGQQASDAVLRDVASTLRSGAASEPELLAAGTLTQPIEATGFEAMAGATVRRPDRRSAPSKKAEPRPDRRRVEAAKQAVSEARTEARRLDREADAAESSARKAREAAEDAAERLAEAQARLEREQSG
jgi:hypothetical protein